MISALMYEYLSSWYNWATGTPNDSVKYVRSTGLCDGAFTYSRHGILYEDKRGCSHRLQTELHQLFREDGLSPVFPFGKENYRAAQANKLQHVCPARLSWVKAKIDQYESQQ